MEDTQVTLIADTRTTNYSDYSVGAEGPCGKNIKVIIIQTEELIVYLDEDDSIEWATSPAYGDFDPAFGDIQNKISSWESVANKVFGKEEAFDYKCLLAEAYARIIDDKNPFMANQVIDSTVNRMKIHGGKLLKQAYILAAFACTIFVMILIVLFVSAKVLLTHIISYDTYDIILTALFGGVGAFVFAVFRIEKYSPDLDFGKDIHQVDGMLRVFYGFISGLIMGLAIKSNAILGFISPITIYLSAFLGIVAGASEVVVPNLIKQGESAIEPKKKAE